MNTDDTRTIRRMLDPTRCPIHDTPLVCPACQGQKGGQIGGKASSPRKTRAARRNAKLPRPRPKRYPDQVAP